MGITMEDVTESLHTSAEIQCSLGVTPEELLLAVHLGGLMLGYKRAELQQKERSC